MGIFLYAASDVLSRFPPNPQTHFSHLTCIWTRPLYTQTKLRASNAKDLEYVLCVRWGELLEGLQKDPLRLWTLGARAQVWGSL